MDTLKTAVVVVLLLAVLYGVYVVLNKPGEPLPHAAAWQSQTMEPLELNIEGPDSVTPDLGSSSNSQTVLSEPAVVPWASQSPEPPVAESSPPAPTQLSSAASEPPPVSTSSIDMPVSAPPLFSQPSSELVSESQPVELPETAQQWPTEPSQVELASTASPADPTPPTPVVVDEVEEAAAAIDASAPEVSSVDTAGQMAASFSPFASAIESAQANAKNEEWYDALWSLSLFYGSPELSEAERQQLQDWLDPLAAKVIYSQEHLIEQGYQAQAGDTLEAVAQRYGVPWQLLANINGVADRGELTPGTELKVIRGPLRAEINLKSSEMTVFAGKLYAGRFPLTIGQDPAPEPGEYRVLDKLEGRTYYAGDGLTIPPRDARNPYGSVWIDLGGELCIHGSSETPGEVRGCIGLDTDDANDLFGILSKGSTVSILR